ncbi:hypothetical protein PHISCL_04922 [Aspergillus sclerotialis]|uniref:Utp8 beta-propeller domain-containing protein n=1 Tax=Aspergillus sclerotialis TaxID=2070753 RepID=A0A3A2ZKA8_9EURO|nr:hypothetical protein PHISCL_04922 [Aspergillus sclerotialis]
MDLQPPSLLAQLPRPLHASTGSTHIGEVYSLTESKKRKRYEVVVAVDGEAVNIYNIQTPKLVTSYAVPPQSSFSCRPCSVRRKLGSSVKRQTYGAVNRPERQIKSFVEESGNGSSAPTISSSSFSVKDSNSPTIFVGIIPTTASEDNDEKDPFDVLTVHQDGRVRRLSSDLGTQRWSVRHSEIAKPSAHEVHACFLIEFEDAKKSLFKRRQDLAALALGNITDSGVDEPSILLLVSHPANSERISPNDVKVQMFSVPANASASGLAVDESQRMRHLLTVNMPGVDGLETLESRGVRWDFHSGSAGLNLSFEQGFINFDLSQYSPTVTSQFILEGEQFSSLMRISPQTVIGAGKSLIALYDTQYQSVQRSIPVGDIQASVSSEKTAFIGYFAKLGIAVASKGSSLLAFDLSPSNTAFGSSFKRPRDGLLIDAIGRGIGLCDARSETPSKRRRTEEQLALTSAEADKWNQLMNGLEASKKSKDADRFDGTVKEYFGTQLLPTSQPIHPELPILLLSKIFSWKETTSDERMSSSPSFRLSVDLWPKLTINWLVQLGYLCASNVEIAVRRSFKPRILPRLPTGSLSQALIDADPSLRRLIVVLQGPAPADTDELAYGLRAFLGKARSYSTTLEETAKAITSGAEDNSKTSMELISSDLQTSLAVTFRGLNTNLQKLHDYPISSITNSLRSTLSRGELVSLIHHLRLSLATGGYIARFTENPPTPIIPSQTKPKLDLKTITDLLSASIDAIGPSGWISANSSDLEPDADLIADMKFEISAALAGVEEATFLKGILKEYMAFADTFSSNEDISSNKETSSKAVSSKKAKKSSREPAEAHAESKRSHLVRKEKLNGAELLVFTSAGGEDGADGDSAGKILPLSLKAPTPAVSQTKVMKSTGEVKPRSGREIGLLRRKQVGKYSFERLFV